MADNPSYASDCIFGRISVFRMNRDASQNYSQIVDGPGRRTDVALAGARGAVVVDPPSTTVLVQWKSQLVQVDADEPIPAPARLARLILRRLQALAA